MSNKSRRRRRARRRQPPRQFPWLWLGVAGGLALIVGLVLFLQLGSADEPQATPQVSGAPRLQVDQAIVDEGYVKFEVPVRTTFRLKNVGDQPLKLLNQPAVQLVEGC